jgi:hypothetical protein
LQDPIGLETVAQIVGAAAARGFELSATQIARWHRYGLLPRPIRKFLGKGVGSKSFYPPGTHRQAVEICIKLKRTRDLADVAWQLWWQGYEVNISVIRAYLSELREQWMHSLDNFIDKQRG